MLYDLYKDSYEYHMKGIKKEMDDLYADSCNRRKLTNRKK